MRAGLGRTAIHLALALLAFVAISVSMMRLESAKTDVSISATVIGEIPATIFRPENGALGPVVVIAHGFAGSQQLMQSFALTFARNGYVAVTFDFLGHGRNPKPLGGSITEEDGATKALVDETAAVAAFSRKLGDGRLAVLGHSMASDIVVRFAEGTPDVAATIAVRIVRPADWKTSIDRPKSSRPSAWACSCAPGTDSATGPQSGSQTSISAARRPMPPAQSDRRLWWVMSISPRPPGSIMNITMKIAMTLISVAIIMICNTPRNSACITRNRAPTAVCENSSASAERTIEWVRKTTMPNQTAAAPKKTRKIIWTVNPVISAPLGRSPPR